MDTPTTPPPRPRPARMRTCVICGKGYTLEGDERRQVRMGYCPSCTDHSVEMEARKKDILRALLREKMEGEDE